MRLFWILIATCGHLAGFSQVKLSCVTESKYASNWQCLGPFTSEESKGDQHFGMITAISINPKNDNEMYVGGSVSGLFHTKDRGKNWTCLTDNDSLPILGIKDIEVDYYTYPHRILIATGAIGEWFDSANFGILISGNGGKTWTHHYREEKDVISTIEIKNLLFDQVHKIWYAHGKRHILRSLDNGITWIDIISPKLNPEIIKSNDYEITSMELNEDGSNLFFGLYTYPVLANKEVSKESQLFEITNCFQSRTNQKIINHTPLLKSKYNQDRTGGTYAIRLSKSKPNSSMLYVHESFVNSLAHAIFYFDMETRAIKECIIPNQGQVGEDIYWLGGLQINPLNPSILYLGGTVLYKSVDSGRNFQRMYNYGYGEQPIPHADIRTYQIYQWSQDGSMDVIYLGTDGGLSLSEDGGKNFQNLNGTHLSITQFYGFGVSPFSGTISGGSQDNGIFSYLPLTSKWIYAPRGDGYDVEYSKRVPGELFGQHNYRTLFANHTDVVPLETNFLIGSFDAASNKKTLQTLSNGDLYFAEKKLHHYQFENQKWIAHDLPTPHQALAFQVSESDPNIIYLSSYWSGLYKSTDGGKSFEDISKSMICNGYFVGGTRYHAICIHPTDPNKVWLSLGYLGDYTDICKSSLRVIYSEDGGLSWSDYSEGLPIYNISDLVFLEGTKAGLFASSIDGIYFREDKFEKWTWFSTNFPRCLVPEIKIDYCRGKLLAATFGRGIWETDLPDCSYNDPLVINKTISFSRPSSKEAVVINRDIVINKKGKLKLNTPLYMAKGRSVYLKKSKVKQLIFEQEGKIINGCDSLWNNIKMK